MFKRLAPNIISITSLGNCCKAAVDLIPVSRPDILLLVDFSSHQKRKGPIADPVLIMRDARTQSYQTGHVCDLLEGNVVSIQVNEEVLREAKLIKGVIAVYCTDAKRTRLVQHFIIKLVK